MLGTVAECYFFESDSRCLGLEIRYGEHLYSLDSRHVGNSSRVARNMAFLVLCNAPCFPLLSESLAEVKASETPVFYPRRDPRQLRLGHLNIKEIFCWSCS